MPPKRPPTGGGRQSRSASSASGGGSSSDDDGSGDDGSSSSSGSGSSSSGSSSSSSSGSSGSGSSSDSGSQGSSTKSVGDRTGNKKSTGNKRRSRSKSQSSAASSADDKKSRRASHGSSGRRESRSGARSSRDSSTASEADVSNSKSGSKKSQKAVSNKTGTTTSNKAERRSSKDHRGHHGRKNSKDKDGSSQSSVVPKAAPKKSATAKTKAASTFPGGGFPPTRSGTGRSNLSENDTDDSDGLKEFSLSKLAVKYKQQKKVSAIHASMLSSSPGSQASPSTNSGGGPNMTPNASIAGSLTPSSLAAGSVTTVNNGSKGTSGGSVDPLTTSSSAAPQHSTTGTSSTTKATSKKANSSSGPTSILVGSANGSTTGNKKTSSNNDKSSALAKSIFSESSENDSESTPVLSKRTAKKVKQSSKAGSKKDRSPSPPVVSSQSASNKKGTPKNKSTGSLGQTVIKQEVTTFTSTKGSSDATNTTSPEKGPTRGRPPKKSAAKMAAEAASKKQKQIQEQQKKKKAQAMTKRKVTRSSSLSSDASEQSSSDSDTEQSSRTAGSGSADTSDDSDNEVSLKTPNKNSLKDKKSNKKVAPKKGIAEGTKKGRPKLSNREPLSSEDESMAPSTAASSAAVSPNKISSAKVSNKKLAGGIRPNTRQRGGTTARRSKHVTGINHSALIDTDSEMEMTSTANESVTSSPRKKSGRGRMQKSSRKEVEKVKTSSFSADDSQVEDTSKKKSGVVKDRSNLGQEPSVPASNNTDRLLATRNLERQASSPSGEALAMVNRNPNSHPTQPTTAHHPAGMSLPPVRRTFEGCTPIEERKCPTPGCDCTGHLSGSTKLDHHFTQDACPMFHNMIKKECRDVRSEINKKHSARRKASSMMAGARSPLGSPSVDQKRHAQMVRDSRETYNEKDAPEFEEVPEDREPALNGFTSHWDLKLFREAQALAAEDCESALRGLPETKQTKYIEMGRHEMEVWYQSPYPEEYTSQPKIYICEFCLKYMRSSCQLRRHAAKCVWNHPPGDEIYRKEPLSVFEICGKRYKQYCQSLCLLAKFFLDHKTLYFDVEPFLFYVMTTADSSGCHIVGYFSKEKNSLLNYNVSCILTLPPYQRQGYGRLLIDFSYLLSREEGKIGSPEKPLSDLGLITYRAYWKDVLLEYICNYPEKELSIKAFSEEMGINPGDIISTLQVLGMIKYWKGQHVILKKEDLIDEYLEKSRSRPKHRQIYPGGLKWKPYEPTAKERRQAAQIQKNQDDRQQKKR